MHCGSVSITAPTVYECEGYRLLTDAEYEYAARASTTEAFYSGPMTKEALADASQCNGYTPLLEIAWYCANAGRFTHPVGLKRPNSWHLYDMMGNVLEWVHDEEKGKTGAAGPWIDPGGSMTAYMYRQTRGGSVVSWPRLLRSASRSLGFTSEFHAPTIGIRLARSILQGGSAAAKEQLEGWKEAWPFSWPFHWDHQRCGKVGARRRALALASGSPGAPLPNPACTFR